MQSIAQKKSISIAQAMYGNQVDGVHFIVGFLDSTLCEINRIQICLIASQFIKDKHKEYWRNLTNWSTQDAIKSINSTLDGIAIYRPSMTSVAALDSINRANNFINEALTILRKIENRGN